MTTITRINEEMMKNPTILLIGCVLITISVFLFSSIQNDKPKLSLLEQQYKTIQKAKHYNIIKNIEKDLLLLDIWDKKSITAIKNKHNVSLTEMNVALLNVSNFKMHINTKIGEK